MLYLLFKREFQSYFSTPLALVFIIIFLILNGFFTFELGGFYQRGQAELDVFFNAHPWLYLILMPALAMGLWSEERKSGTIELMLTLPVSLIQVALAKFLAAWSIAGLALALTFPIWITVNYLGAPDNGIIVAGYIGSFFLAGCYLAIGAFMSAMTQNQVIAFILSVVTSIVFLLIGFPALLDVFSGWMPQLIIDALASLSFITHFDAISKGVLDLRDIVFFTAFIVTWLIASVVTIDMKKSN